VTAKPQTVSRGSARVEAARSLGIPEDDPPVKAIRTAPHFCRMGHVAIRFWHADEDERCPLCRTLDALVAETLQGDAP
jgi:hypothetical protein